jgi:hypothetical protein
MAKGFKGKYFSFNAICATTNTQTLQRQCSTFASHLKLSFTCEDELDPEEPIDVLSPDLMQMEPDCKVSHLAPP